MKLPRDLSGRSLAGLLVQRWDYRMVHQTGSHIILDTKTPSPQRLSIPDHRVLRIGTLSGILRAVAHHKAVTREDILGTR